MSAWTVGVLLALACAILFCSHGRVSRWPRRGWNSPFRRHLSGRLRGRSRDKPDPWLWPMLVYQLAALLQAGRAPQTIWRDLIRTHSPTQVETSQLKPRAADDEVLVVLRAADRAAALGQGVAPVLRQYAAAATGGPATGRESEPRTGRVCSELAVCWEVAERSGAPLAKLLHRYEVGS